MKYIKLYETYNSVLESINWRLIEDMKDMSLEYLDEDKILNIKVLDEEYDFFYGLEFGHNINVVHKVHSKLDKKQGRFVYWINLYSTKTMFDQEAVMCKELIERVKESYPDEIIKHNYGSYYEDDDYVVDEWDGWNVTYPDPYEDD